MSDSYFSQARPEMLKFLPPTASRILEVGCGSGAFGKSLKGEYGDSELVGVEFDPRAAEKSRAIFDTVWVGDVNEVLAQKSDQKFDLVIFNDILEHLVDPWRCLLLVGELLQPGGYVVASIPNMRFWPILSDLLFQGDWRYRDAGVMDKTHLRFFTNRSIKRFFNDCGYRILRIEGINKTAKYSIRWKALNLLLSGDLGDCLYPQFAVVAVPFDSPNAQQSFSLSKRQL